MSQNPDPRFNYLRYATMMLYFFSSIAAIVFMTLAIIRSTFEAAYVYDVSGDFQVPNVALLALEVGTPIFSVMFDAVVILGIQLMLNRIYIMNVLKSSIVIALMVTILAVELAQKPNNPFSSATELAFVGSGVVAIVFNGLAMLTSLVARNLERKMYG